MRCIYIVVCCLLVAALSACAGARRNVDASAAGPGLEDLAGRGYFLVSMDEKAPEGGTAPELGFDREGRVSARACNRFSGQARIVNGTLTAKHAAATRMACAQPFLNALEQTLSDMLRHGARIRLDGSRLTLERDGHTLVYALPSPKP